MSEGHAGIGDYARERLGIKASTAVKMARRAQQLRECPLLRNAVWLGVVSISKADAILPVARGGDEESWVARARRDTVNALEKAVRRSAGVEPEEDEKWERVFVQLFPEARPVWDKALEIAGRVLGLATPKWQRIEVICQEYLGAHTPPDERDGKEGPLRPIDELAAGAQGPLGESDAAVGIPGSRAASGRAGAERGGHGGSGSARRGAAAAGSAPRRMGRAVRASGDVPQNDGFVA